MESSTPKRTPSKVDACELYRDPQRYHNQYVTVDGLYTSGLEGAGLAGADVSGGIPGPCRLFVRATGTWLSGGERYGHLGMSSAELRVDEMEPIEPTPYRTVQPDDAIRMKDDCFRVVRLFRPVRCCFGELTADTMKLDGLTEPEEEPWERDAQVLAVVYPKTLAVLKIEWLSERRTVTAVELASAEQLAQRVKELVRLPVVLGPGFYWPEIERAGERSVTVIPPELSRTGERYTAGTRPPHPIVAKWKERLQAGPVQATIEGYVYCSDTVFATTLEVTS